MITKESSILQMLVTIITFKGILELSMECL